MATAASTPSSQPAGGPENSKADDMDDIERNNYNVLKKSPKGWTEQEARYLATNPIGRLEDDPWANRPAKAAQPTRREVLYGNGNK